MLKPNHFEYNICKSCLAVVSIAFYCLSFDPTFHNEFPIITLQVKEYLLKKSSVLFQGGILLMITSSVLFGIAIALSGSITIGSFEVGNATNSIKGNQFIDIPVPCIVQFLGLWKKSR